MPVDYITLFKNLESGVVDLAKTTLADYLNDGISDGKAIINNMKANIETWTLALAVCSMIVNTVMAIL
jgi:hypothetical protein